MLYIGLGVDEKALISILGKWHPEQRQTYRKGTRDFFIEDERQFERWDDYHVIQLQHEFLRFKVPPPKGRLKEKRTQCYSLYDQF